MDRKTAATLWAALNCSPISPGDIRSDLVYRVMKMLERECGTAYALRMWDKEFGGAQSKVDAALKKLEASD